MTIEAEWNQNREAVPRIDAFDTTCTPVANGDRRRCDRQAEIAELGNGAEDDSVSRCFSLLEYSIVFLQNTVLK